MTYVEIDARTKIVLVLPQEQPEIPNLEAIGRICIDVTDNAQKDQIQEGWIYNEETKIFSTQTITLKQKIQNMGEQISLLIDKECRKDIYFHGLGFADGLLSVAKYPTNPDAIKLSNWAEEFWTKASQIKAQVLAGTKDIDTIILTEEIPEL